MNRKFALLLIMMTLLLKVLTAWGMEGDEPGVSYFTDKQRGWFWYEVQPEPVLKRKPQPSKVVPSLPSITETPPRPITPVEPEPLTSAWLVCHEERLRPFMLY